MGRPPAVSHVATGWRRRDSRPNANTPPRVRARVPPAPGSSSLVSGHEPHVAGVFPQGTRRTERSGGLRPSREAAAGFQAGRHGTRAKIST